ncbi:YggT family protein [Frigoribacterium sp. CFBP9039]|uniref:YggT family protein n=1 Tax=Frigoribacterium TaxID=96492 RepID=UPI001785A5C4|nr:MULTISPECIES: YggT family protein [Frigoribacterium]MBD8703586.1 YggT family protein [Frigoribacterium sp. CFBP 13712]MCJ0700190.1 YggT family protein [Frigoribacterium faeni]MDY0890905.1 YggT family protein [Frigoribacterium sp. CFBP9030]MDY0945136.1 YggT family protein [Frigoribacterium sp. CFBP9039]
MIVSLIATIAYYLLLLFFLMMWARFVLDLAQSFSRGWRPRGPVLVLAEVTYTVTDPPIRAVRKVLPPVRLGSVALDFGWSLIMLAVIILMSVTSYLR